MGIVMQIVLSSLDSQGYDQLVFFYLFFFWQRNMDMLDPYQLVLDFNDTSRNYDPVTGHRNISNFSLFRLRFIGNNTIFVSSGIY